MGAKGTFTERIAPGAFDASIAAGASLWFMHDSKQILANTKSGTLTLESDAQGLKYTATLGDSQRDADVLDLVKRGVVSEMSFGFSVPSGGDSWSGEKRTLNQINLREISVVEVGAYSNTTSSVRSQETPVITKVIKPMNIRTMNAKLAELRAQNVEGTEVENRAEIVAQIEEITEARNAAMAAADGIREAATPIQRTMDRRDAGEEWRASPEYRDQWLSYLRGGRMPEQRAAMTTANPATNSVLIPKLYTDAMAHYAQVATVARQLVDYKSGVQGYQTLRYNTLFSNDAITNAWTVSDVGTQASTEINPVFAEVPLAPAACLPFTTVSKQLLLQSNFDLEAEVVENLNRQFVRNAEWGLLSGGGSTGTNGSTLNQPTGLFTVQTGCTIATATSTGTSRALALTAACTVVNLTAMRYTSLPASYWGTASWLMGQDVYAKIAALTINGVPVFVPSADAVGQAGAGFTLMGLPVYVSEFTGPTQATGAGAKNTIFSLGNHNEGYSAREWAGATIMRDDLSLAAAAQVKFQGTMFMNGNFTRAKAIVQMQVTNA